MFAFVVLASLLLITYLMALADSHDPTSPLFELGVVRSWLFYIAVIVAGFISLVVASSVFL